VKDRLFGIETEYALTVLVKDGAAMDRPTALHTLMSIAQETLVCLPGASDKGLFTENGSRFYVDCGLHPEWATPECSDPKELVRYVLAGERALAQLVEQLAKATRASEVICSKCNVDYAGASTWGSHESILHRADPAALPDQLVPHLVTRIIYTGAGGFNSLSKGLEWTMSPRVHHLRRIVSDSSTQNRGIFHTKDETLSSDGYHRLHILCGESLASERASWLRIGVTALIVALIEAGERPAENLQLQTPLKAMTAIASDPTCQKEVRLADGRSMTAREIQFEYLRQVKARLREAYMPAWAEDVCQGWEAILECLAGAPQTLERKLDWAIKLAIFRDYIERNGLLWDEIPILSAIRIELESALKEKDLPNKPVSLDVVLAPDSPMRPTVERLKTQNPTLDWETFRKFLDLRRQLFEIDVRYGQLGPRGIFAQLDSAGVLDHRVAGVNNIRRAQTEPPPMGRAHARGFAIRQLAGAHAAAGWTFVHDYREKPARALDLSDPFAGEAQWKDLPHQDEAGLREWLSSGARDLLNTLWR